MLHDNVMYENLYMILSCTVFVHDLSCKRDFLMFYMILSCYMTMSCVHDIVMYAFVLVV